MRNRMSLQKFLEDQFMQWVPPEPEMLSRTKCSVTLDWSKVEPFQFMADRMLYRLEKDNKYPPWIVVYRGGKTTKVIDNLTPRYPHKFRVKVIVEAEAVPTLADRAVQFYGSEDAVYRQLARVPDREQGCGDENETTVATVAVAESAQTDNMNENGDEEKRQERSSSAGATTGADRRWIESKWSEVTWANTDSDGTSAVCFCMAVRCGFIKQVQSMLEERPELIGILNPSNGYTPLATAVRKGDIGMVRYVVSAGAELEQRSASGQTPLQLAVLEARIPIVDLLLERGADFKARDLNGLRVEHYAVDSCDVETLRYILDKGGDVSVEDNNGWTPLFRALCQGADTAIVEELVVRGSDLTVADRAGLPLTSVARIMTNRHGRNRDSVLRLVDASYPHELAMAHFTRLTKKIHNVHTLLKLPSLTNKPNLRH